MRRPSSSVLLRILVLAGILVPAGAAGASTLGAASPERAAANSVTFQDSTGEDPQAPDITTVVVSNDDARTISFRINVPNRPQLGQDMIVDVLVDSDRNPATGDAEGQFGFPGADYAIQLFRGEVFLYRWDGTGFTRTPGDPPSTSLTYAYAGGVTIRINASELGNTTRFSFGTDVISGITFDPTTGEPDFTQARADFAPAVLAGLYPFELKITPASLLVRKFSRSPARPTAGRPFSLRMTVARSDTGAVLQSGRVTCVGRIGRSPLRATTARVVTRVVTCTWNIPRAATGKTFRGSASVVFEGLKASRSYSAKIG
jgi:hypothetical protein